jgi:hypothetical protein
MTETEINTRATMREVLAYLKEACPVAFRNAYIYDIAPQLGCRCSRRLQGEYVMTPMILLLRQSSTTLSPGIPPSA